MPMTRLHKTVNVIAVVTPLLAFLAAVGVFWSRGLSALDLGMLIGFYVLTCLGVTLGFHRLLTHRSFTTYKGVEYALAILGSMAVEGPVISWVADHRKHHAHTDKAGDPHSPHHGFGGGVGGTLKGLFHAHVGWLWDSEERAVHEKYARDLVEDRGMRVISALFPFWAVLSLALPFGIAWAVTGTLEGGLLGLLWGGAVRVFLLHHVTWSTNSICHFLGNRRFEVDDKSGNVFWLALPSLGEAWHHNHHAFPRSAAHGLRFWEIDVTALVIRGMERVGLARNVVRISAERQAQRMMGAAGGAAAPPRQQQQVGV